MSFRARSFLALVRWSLAAALALHHASIASAQQELVVASSNVESGEATTEWIGREIIGKIKAHVWGFSEVLNEQWAVAFEEAAEEAHRRDYNRVLGTTGFDDRLLVIYDDDLLDNVASFELHEINIEGKVRAPLVVRFRITTSGHEFLFMVNHLYRGNSAGRHKQASMLNAWAKTQTLPVIAVGDYNFDWNLPKGENDHDQGFDNMVRDGVFVWVRPPDPLVQTQCSTTFNSVLDFVFASGAAQKWKGTSQIHNREPEFCNDDEERPDHRPLTGTFTIADAGTVPDPIADVLAHLRQLMAEVQQQIAALSVVGRQLTPEEKITLQRLQILIKELQQAEASVKK